MPTNDTVESVRYTEVVSSFVLFFQNANITESFFLSISILAVKDKKEKILKYILFDFMQGIMLNGRNEQTFLANVS